MPPLDHNTTIFLLGAGASVSAGIQDAIKMRDRMLEMFGDDELQRHYLCTTRMIIGALQMAAGVRREELHSNIDIEKVLSAVKLLGARFDSELNPFVGGWHPFLEELERTYFAIPFEDILKTAGANANAEIARRLSRRLDGKLFRGLATVLTANLMQLTWLEDPNKSAYLRPLLLTAKTTRLVIATLNYDNTVELAADALQIPCPTLGDWQTTALLPEPSVGIDLLKLHGSTNWKWSDKPHVSAGVTPPRTIHEVSSVDMPKRIKTAKMSDNSDYVGDLLGVLFGGGNKLTAEGPFIDLFYKFKRLLWEKQHLIVIGYSFRDDHINHLIEHWFNANPNAKITLVDAPGGDVNRHRFCLNHNDLMGTRLCYDNSGAKTFICTTYGSPK